MTLIHMGALYEIKEKYPQGSIQVEMRVSIFLVKGNPLRLLQTGSTKGHARRTETIWN